MATVFENMMVLLNLGGPVVAIIFCVSILALALILLKTWQFWVCRAGNGHGARILLNQLRAGQAMPNNISDAQQRNAASSAVALAFWLKKQGFKKTEIEEEVGRHAAVKMHELQSGLRLLDAIAQLAPLMGLFGTVLGMIDAFQQMQGAGSNVDPSLLAGGIWVALLTTAAGLVVAMPVSLVLTLFETRIENERIAIETLVSEALSPVLNARAREDVVRDFPAGSAVHAH